MSSLGPETGPSGCPAGAGPELPQCGLGWHARVTSGLGLGVVGPVPSESRTPRIAARRPAAAPDPGTSTEGSYLVILVT